MYELAIFIYGVTLKFWGAHAPWFQSLMHWTCCFWHGHNIQRQMITIREAQLVIPDQGALSIIVLLYIHTGRTMAIAFTIVNTILSLNPSTNEYTMCGMYNYIQCDYIEY